MYSIEKNCRINYTEGGTDLDDKKSLRKKQYMKYMRTELKCEYERYSRDYPDIPGINAPQMNISDILRAYFILADYFSDPTAEGLAERMLIGIRDMNLLASALGRQNVAYMGQLKYKQPLDICATLFFGLVKDHAFSDGNKRTALLTLLYQLDCYGYRPQANQKDFEKLVVAVAADEMDMHYKKLWKHASAKDKSDRVVEVISRLLKQMTKKKDSSFHTDITAIEFAHAVARIPDCSYDISGNKIKYTRKIITKRWFGQTSTRIKAIAIPYRGNTRVIGAGTAREVLDALELYDQFPDYQSFFVGTDPRYMLISQFEGPLRRLKDK